MATCSLFGGKEEEAMHTSIALEMLHNAFLVHDDIEDESEDRRGKPTIHAQFGIPIAINLGDAMNVLSIGQLMKNLHTLGSELSWKVFAEIEHMVLESVEGQALELGWRKDNIMELQEDDYLLMVLKKTCWYTTTHPIRIGAIIGSQGKVDPDVFNRFGYYLGAAFQIQDDLLNLIGEKETYGKEIAGDILEGKRTLMLIHLMNSATTAEKKWLKAYLAKPRPDRSPKDTNRVLELMVQYKCIEYGSKVAKNLAGAALKEYYSLFGSFPDSEEKSFLENVILYMISRDK